MKVSKEFKWEAAHRLVHGYPGNCSQLHGHSYVATVVMESRSDTLNRFGFVKDFNDMKKVKEWVDTNWDHGTLVSSDDRVLFEWLASNNQRHYIIDHNPTAETLGVELFKVAANLLDDKYCKVVEVRVNETCTSEAVISTSSMYIDKTEESLVGVSS